MSAPAETAADPFLALGIDPAIARAVAEEGYTDPTEVQRLSIPPALAGRDLLALAQTGTGKTAAFALPILHRLHLDPRRGPRAIRALILAPTRELAIQVTESIRAYGRHLSLRATVILGGVSAVPQIAELRRTPDILVATPGRLLDLMGQGHVRIDQVEVFVLDEADRMLDMGFIQDVRKVVAKLPTRRQTLFFSATMPAEVGRLADQILVDPTRVQATPPTSVPRKIEQRIFLVGRLEKRKLLAWLLQERKGLKRVLVFSRTKRRADTVVKFLRHAGISVAAIHSNKTQGARQTALAGFSTGKVRVLVATDIVARGIDVEDISHVVNFDLPHEPESYVHRIGRTARAGAGGIAWSFCDEEELDDLRQIEQVMQRRLEIDADHPFHETRFAPLPLDERAMRRAAAKGSGGGASRSRGGRAPARERDTDREAPRDAGRDAERGRARAARPERARQPGRRDAAPGDSRRGGADRDRGSHRSPARVERRDDPPPRPRASEPDLDDNFSAGIFGNKRSRPTGSGEPAPRRGEPGRSEPPPRDSRRRESQQRESGHRESQQRDRPARAEGQRRTSDSERPREKRGGAPGHRSRSPGDRDRPRDRDRARPPTGYGPGGPGGAGGRSRPRFPAAEERASGDERRPRGRRRRRS